MVLKSTKVFQRLHVILCSSMSTYVCERVYME
jgi:hypothetical protein